MAGFLYYLPGSSDTISADRLAEAGLLDRVRCERMEHRGVIAGGPDGGAGMVVTMRPEVSGGATADVGVHRDRQEWQKSPCGKFWAGMEITRPPLPADLRREQVVAGTEFELGDQNLWLVPIGRSALGELAFESRMRLGPNGEWVSDVLPKYRSLVDASERIWNSLLSAGEASMEDSEAISLAIRILAVNYRLGPVEASLLGLLTSHNIGRILSIFVDIPRLAKLMEASEKKTIDSDGSG